MTSTNRAQGLPTAPRDRTASRRSLRAAARALARMLHRPGEILDLTAPPLEDGGLVADWRRQAHHREQPSG